MPLPEGYLPREGDIVVVHASVKYNVESGDDSVHLAFPGNADRPLIMAIATIEGLFARHWDEGDAVRVIEDHACTGSVIATSGSFVWMKNDRPGAGMTTYLANELEPIPQPMPAGDIMPAIKPPTAPGADLDDVKPF